MKWKIKAKQFIKSLIFFLLGIVCAGIFAFFFMTAFVNVSKIVEVPYLVGENKNIALNSLKELNLIPNLIGSGDTVLYTDPPAGTKVKQGHHVIVQLRDIDSLVIPDLIGIPTEVAKQFLEGYNISYEIRNRLTNNPEQHGIILEISPSAGKEYFGEKVILYNGKYEGVK